MVLIDARARASDILCILNAIGVYASMLFATVRWNNPCENVLIHGVRMCVCPGIFLDLVSDYGSFAVVLDRIHHMHFSFMFTFFAFYFINFSSSLSAHNRK